MGRSAAQRQADRRHRESAGLARLTSNYPLGPLQDLLVRYGFIRAEFADDKDELERGLQAFNDFMFLPASRCDEDESPLELALRSMITSR